MAVWNGAFDVKALLRTSTTFWVSQSAKTSNGEAKKQLYNSNTLRGSPCSARNVNKNVNKRREISLALGLRPFKATKNRKKNQNSCYPSTFNFLSPRCPSVLSFSLPFYPKLSLLSLWRYGTEKKLIKSLHLHLCSRLNLNLLRIKHKTTLGTKERINLIESRKLSITSYNPKNLSKINQTQCFLRPQLSKAQSKRTMTLERTKQKNLKPRLKTKKGTNLINLLQEPKVFSSSRHINSVITMRNIRSSDVETNPGPETHRNLRGPIEVISYNVRGLNDQKKLRHLVNFCYKKNPSKNKDLIFCFQETFIEKPGIIPFLWRGNFHLTPGRGNSSGCLTLLSNHINILHSKDFDNRAHALVCQKSDDQKASFIILNVYAPNANNNRKIAFFEEVLNEIAELQVRYDCENTLVMGDFNLIFKQTESKNRAFSSQEKNVARAVKPILNDLNLKDIAIKEFTWRRPNSDSFSSIDRMFYNGNLKLKDAKVNWSVSMSDHAAIEAFFEIGKTDKRNGTRMSRLDPTLFKEERYKERIKQELRTMLITAPNNWNPHLKLEYLKMCVRTVTERIQAERKSNEKNEEELLDFELDIAIKALANEDTRNRAEIILHIEELRSQKEIMIDKKGQRLADKLGTKWYQEGEKSTRYFLRIMNRTCPDNFKELTLREGETTSDPEKIKQEIVRFYKELYENYDKSNLQENNDDNFFDELTPINEANQSQISAPVTNEEILRILKTCKDSSPGPDGISYSIWREIWEEAGPILMESWNHSLRTGKLPPSHKISFLKLIPKPGKDAKLLTNWRPITLSDCDHKIFTKLYANRICDKVATSIGENQTAYLKGRLINDNVRSLIANIKIANMEENIDATVISLDARKAFDSIEHSFIEKCLIRFGMHSFVPIFRMLYSDLRSDILINGEIVRGYSIKRGVKQGDALSCVLFIMCMEPLLRNIEKNVEIEPIFSQKLNSNLPKTYAYADDVNCVTKNNQSCIQQIFKEYERLTKLSGLTLNAEKTEILRIKSNNLQPVIQPPFSIRYLEEQHQLRESLEIKVNGILLSQNENDMRKNNVESVRKKIDNHLKRWSQRNLSVLGRILIVKTFGISQIIYIMQSMCLDQSDYKIFNALLYKFIWNRNYAAAKAPERIRREIMNKPTKLGGFGMLDISELDNSLKLKALGRLEGTNHPMLKLLKQTLDFTNFFYPTQTVVAEDVMRQGLKLFGEDRRGMWGERNLYSNRIFVQAIKNLKIKLALSPNGRQSLSYFNIRLRGKTKLAELSAQEIRSLSPFMNPNLTVAAIETIQINPGNLDPTSDFLYYNGRALTPIAKLTSKTIRNLRADKDPICVLKAGPVLTPNEARTWAFNASKLTSTRLKDLVLRLSHGELYYRERLFRYNLIENPLCLRCGEIETLMHKYVTCSYIAAIWRAVTKLTMPTINPHQVPIETVLCTREPDLTKLTIHAEIILRIRLLKPELNYSIHPRIIAKKAIEHLLKKEKNEAIKNELKDLLNDQ